MGLHKFIRQLKKLFEFRGFGHILNPSRTVPSTLAIKSTLGGNSVLIAAGSKDTVIQFATLLFLTEDSKIYSLQEVLEEDRRALKGIPQIVEWERMQSVLCMACRIPYANINMRAGSIQFCTAKTMRYSEFLELFILFLKLTASGTPSSPAKNPSKLFKKTPEALSASAATSPFSGAKHAVTGKAFGQFITINCIYILTDCAVPVLDARGSKFNLEADLFSLDQKLPGFIGEIPQGSCVWVGYTCTKYDSKERGPGLNFNLMWTVVMGTP